MCCDEEFPKVMLEENFPLSRSLSFRWRSDDDDVFLWWCNNKLKLYVQFSILVQLGD